MLWKSPTPHEESLAKIDDFLRTHEFNMQELISIKKFYGDKRTFGLRKLRLEAAIQRVRALIGRPVISL